MAEFHTALRVDVGEDLLPLLALLQQRGVRCRVFEEGGRQVLKVVRPQDVEPVQELYRAWRAGEVTIELRGERRPQPRSATRTRRAPPSACRRGGHSAWA